MRTRAPLSAALFTLLTACGAEPPAPQAPPAPEPAPTAPAPTRKTIRRLDAEYPRVVVIQPEGRRVVDEPGQVYLHGHAGWRKEAYLQPRAEGGSHVLESVESVGPSKLVRRPRNGPMELLLPDGKLVALGDRASAIDPWVFVARRDAYAIVDAKTGAERGARPRDPAKEEHSIPLPAVHGGDRLIEQISTNDGDEVRFSKLPSLALGLARKGRVAGIDGRFALVLAPDVKAKKAPGGEQGFSVAELIDVEAFKIIAAIRLPKALHDGASFAIAPDGRRIAAAVRGGIYVHDLASKRWTTPKKEIKYPDDLIPPISSIGFTPDGKHLCLRHVSSFALPAPRIAKGKILHALFDSPRPGFYDGNCHLAVSPRWEGSEPLADGAFNFKLQHVGAAVSPGHDLGAILEVQKEAPGSDAPREVHLSVVELATGKWRYRVPVGKWVPDYTADHLTVGFTPAGVWVYATTRGDEASLGGLFDPVTGKRTSPIWIQPGGARVTFADILSRLGVKKIESGWAKLKVDKGSLVATDDKGGTHDLATKKPLPYSARRHHGGPKSGATLVDDGDHAAWIFASDGAGFLGTLVPAGKGLVAFLEGGAVDLVGDVDEATLGCLESEDRLLPFAACKDRVLVRGAAADARAGKLTWLEGP